MKTIKCKTAIVTLLFALFLVSSCATMKPKSQALRRTTRMVQDEIQYEHSLSSLDDWMRSIRHGWNAPKKMTRIPFTQFYIF